jgi:hypothetical protein
MQNKIFIIVTAFLLTALILSGAYSQEDMEEVSNEYFPAPQRSTVLFEHDNHNETAEIEDCDLCHHLYDEDGNLVEDESSEDQMCADCHELDDKGKQPGLRKAFHQNCKGCHMTEQKGPVMCGECHLN